MDGLGDVIEVPRTGEKFVFLKRPRDTNGELLEIDFYVREFAPPGQAHIHMKTEERVEVIEGTARVRMGREERSMGPGEWRSFRRAWCTPFNRRGEIWCIFGSRPGPG